MHTLETLAALLPDSCKDLRLNLLSVLRESTLSEKQRWSVALASAYFLHLPELAAVLKADPSGGLTTADVEDAQAAAALMGMTTIYYRFRHLAGRPSYTQMRAGLRMNRMQSPATSRSQFELCALACAALAGCEACIKSHDASLLKEGISEEQVHDAARIAACVSGFGVALGIAGQS